MAQTHSKSVALTISPAELPATRSKPVDSGLYPILVVADLSFPQRTAQYLHEAAAKWPYQLIRYDEIFRNINFLKKRGAIPEADLKRVMAWVRVSQRWLAAYGRHVVYGEFGARASVDDQDVVESVAPGKIRRVVRAIERAKDVDSLVNTKNLKGEMGQWYKTAYRPALQQLEKVKENLLEAAPEAKQLPGKS